MQTKHPITTDLVFVGGGHSHAIALLQFAMHPLPGVGLTLISPESVTPYSGMLPGHLANCYTYDECHIDLRRLAAAAGAQFWVDSVTDIDPNHRWIYCVNHPDLQYDWLSVDIGSTPLLPDIPGALDYGLPVKPWQSFLDQWQDWLSQVSAHPEKPVTLVIVGGGAGGVELALNVQTRLEQLFSSSGRGGQGRDSAVSPLKIHLIHRGPWILDQHNPWVRRRCSDLLWRRGIQLHLNDSVLCVSPNHLQLASGSALAFDQLFWVTGAQAPDWIAKTGLATTRSGFIQVDQTLRSPSHPQVFATGDIATMVASPRPKAGVFAVRQGKPLAENLRRAILGQPLKPFKPQHNFLSLIGTGTAEAIASWGPFPWGAQSTQLWRLKDWIDRKFMTQFSELPMRDMRDAIHPPPFIPTGLPNLYCAGCGSKVSRTVLDKVFSRIAQEHRASMAQRVEHRPDILIGLADNDDAAVVQVPIGKAMVHTLDYFSSLINDPYVFGQICTHHALSDLYAMGAIPQTVLAIATLPHGRVAKQEALLYHLLSGCLSVLADADAALVGGHTTEGDELVFGLACNGLVDPEKIIRKQGLKPNQALILTQPLGIGVLFAAQMQGLAKARWLDQALAYMLQSNQDAARIARSFGTLACTDVTGFGLVGHLWEMVNASQQSVVLDFNRIPWLAGAVDMSQRGVRSSLYEQNATIISELRAGSAIKTDPHWPLLFDPQTSGGLLFAIPEADAADCLAELQFQGYPRSQIVGRTLDPCKTSPFIQIH